MTLSCSGTISSFWGEKSPKDTIKNGEIKKGQKVNACSKQEERKKVCLTHRPWEKCVQTNQMKDDGRKTWTGDFPATEKGRSYCRRKDWGTISPRERKPARGRLSDGREKIQPGKGKQNRLTRKGGKTWEGVWHQEEGKTPLLRTNLRD